MRLIFYNRTFLNNFHCQYLYFHFNEWQLEQRQYKNDSIQSKVIPTLNLPRPITTTRGKKEGISKLELFLTEWNRSYIVLALDFSFQSCTVRPY